MDSQAGRERPRLLGSRRDSCLNLLCTSVADHESYRTFQAFPTPTEALTFAQQLVGDMLGVFLAGQEWRRLGEGLGHSPLRQDLQFGLSHHGPDLEEPPDE
jgi:hypothetical protein